MLEILLLIWIGRSFGKYAKKHKLSSALWTTLGVLSYILGEVIGVVIMLAVNPAGIENILLVYVYALPTAGALIFITYSLMANAAKNAQPAGDSEILDKDMLEE